MKYLRKVPGITSRLSSVPFLAFFLIFFLVFGACGSGGSSSSGSPAATTININAPAASEIPAPPTPPVLDTSNLATYDIMNFGAVGDGAADDTGAIQSAIGAASLLGGVVFCPAGTYKLSSALKITSSNIVIQGEGSSTVFDISSAASDGFDVGNGTQQVTGIFLRNFKLTSSVTKTAGSGIFFNSAFNVSASSINIEKQFYAVQMKDTIIAYLDQDQIYQTRAENGVGIYISGGNDQYLSNLVMDNAPDNQPLAGIYLAKTGGTWVDKVDVIHSGTGLYVKADGGNPINYLFISNSAFDTNNAEGIRIQDNGGGVKSVQVNNSWTSTNSKNGLAVYGPVDGVYILGHRSYNNTNHGILINAGTNITVDSSYLSGNSVLSPGQSHGIAVNSNVTGFDLRNNRSGQMAGFGDTQGYGIVLLSGTSDNYMIIQNDLRGNLLTGLSDGGTGKNKVVENNLQGP